MQKVKVIGLKNSDSGIVEGKAYFVSPQSAEVLKKKKLVKIDGEPEAKPKATRKKTSK